MSGEESLAQVNREIEHPKLKTWKRAALVIAVQLYVYGLRLHACGQRLFPDAVLVQSTATT